MISLITSLIDEKSASKIKELWSQSRRRWSSRDENLMRSVWLWACDSRWLIFCRRRDLLESWNRTKLTRRYDEFNFTFSSSIVDYIIIAHFSHLQIRFHSIETTIKIIFYDSSSRLNDSLWMIDMSRLKIMKAYKIRYYSSKFVMKDESITSNLFIYLFI